MPAVILQITGEAIPLLKEIVSNKYAIFALFVIKWSFDLIKLCMA